jgi:hypothetical protein
MIFYFVSFHNPRVRPKTNPRPALPASGKPMSTGKKGKLLCRILGIAAVVTPCPVPVPVEFKLFVRLDSRGCDNVCNFSQFIFRIPCDCKYARAAKNIPATIASIFIMYLIAKPMRKPAIPPKPTLVKRGVKLFVVSAIIYYYDLLR